MDMIRGVADEVWLDGNAGGLSQPSFRSLRATTNQ